MIRRGHMMQTNEDENESELLEEEKSTSPAAAKELEEKHLAERKDERQLWEEEARINDQRCSSDAEQVCKTEELDLGKHPLEVQMVDLEADCEEQEKKSASDQPPQHKRREMDSDAPIKECEESGTSSEMTHSVTDDSDSTPDAVSKMSSMLENFPVANPRYPVFLHHPSSSSNPFHRRIPCSIFCGSGLSTNVEFEVKVAVLGEEWTMFRHYCRFHQLHTDLLARYSQIYLQKLLEVLYNTAVCPLHPSRANV